MSNEQFTLEDIHRIRYDNFENSKQMSPEELIESTRRQAETGKQMLDAIRNQTKTVSGN
jgi:hypothetical protein